MVGKELLNEAKSMIEKAGRIVLAFPKHDLDAALAAELLLRILSALKKDIFVTEKEIGPSTIKLPLRALTEAGLIRKDLVVVIEEKPSPVGELRYEKNDEALKIIISSKSGTIPLSAVEVTHLPLRADLVITVGVTRLEDLGTAYQENPQLFFETPILAIAENHTKQHEGDLVVADDSARSLVEPVFQLRKTLLPKPLEKDEATVIFAGIAAKTENLLQPTISVGTLEIVAECAVAGADRALVLGSPRVPAPPLLQLFGRSMVRSKQLGHVIVSVLTGSDLAITKVPATEVGGIFDLWRPHLETPLLVLLWQDPQTNLISGLLYLRDLNVKIPEAFKKVREHIFSFQESFSSFQEAEERILPLLEG